jgi:hypothetical protein
MDKFKERYELLSLPEGQIAFYGNVQVGDRGVDEFFIKLNAKKPLFGEWEHFYHKDKIDKYANDFDVKVISFGYGSPTNVGNPQPGARSEFSIQEKEKIGGLIIKLFERELLKLKSGNRDSCIFRGLNPSYLGNVIFEDDWIRTRRS